MAQKSKSAKRLREAARKVSPPRTVDDLYGGGVTGNLLQGRFTTDRVYAWFQKRHLRGATLVVNEEGYYHRGKHTWKVPYGVRWALKQRLTHAQIVTRFPFYVILTHPQSGRRVGKNFASLARAVQWCAEKGQYIDPSLAIVSRHGYMIPAKLRGKLPRRMGRTNTMHYWCPCCMDARPFKRVDPPSDFHALKKVWSDDKGKYIWVERRIARLACTTCGITNQNHKFRTSNQPWEVRKLKSGARRAKRRR